jgi:hypothetical protein
MDGVAIISEGLWQADSRRLRTIRGRTLDFASIVDPLNAGGL